MVHFKIKQKRHIFAPKIAVHRHKLLLSVREYKILLLFHREIFVGI